MKAEVLETKREHDSATHTVTLHTEAGSLTFDVNEEGDFIFGSPSFEPSGEAWARIAEVVVPCEQCGVTRDKHPAGDGLTECPGDFGTA